MSMSKHRLLGSWYLVDYWADDTSGTIGRMIPRGLLGGWYIGDYWVDDTSGIIGRMIPRGLIIYQHTIKHITFIQKHLYFELIGMNKKNDQNNQWISFLLTFYNWTDFCISNEHTGLYTALFHWRVKCFVSIYIFFFSFHYLPLWYLQTLLK
jgi:hypothetical protein